MKTASSRGLGCQKPAQESYAGLLEGLTGVPGVGKCLFDRLGLGNQFGIEGRSYDVPAFLRRFEVQDEFSVAFRVSSGQSSFLGISPLLYHNLLPLREPGVQGKQQLPDAQRGPFHPIAAHAQRLLDRAAVVVAAGMPGKPQ